MSRPAANAPWDAFYHSSLQSPWLLLVAPFAYLVYRWVRGPTDPPGPAGPRGARFVAHYGLFWAIATMLDPLASGPLGRALGLAGTSAGTLVMLLFVLLGDLRVFVWIFGLAGVRRPLVRSAAFTAIVPLCAGLPYFALRALVADLPQQILWLAYELEFVAVAAWLARVWVPRNVAPRSPALARVLRASAGYVGVYYALWAAADVVILCGFDEGWALRVIPNQLYYGFWVPFVHARYSCERSAPIAAS